MLSSRLSWNRRGRVAATALLASVCLLPLIPRGVHAGTDARGFSEGERKSLDAGELVRRPMSEDRGGLQLIGGTSYQVIDAPPSVVWQALVDTPRYPRMLPQVLEARMVEESEDKRQVFMRQGKSGLLEAEYYLNVSLDRPRGEIRFEMAKDKPHDLRAAWGFYNIRSFGRGQTLLTYGIMADIGSGMLTSLVRNSVQDWMLKTPWMVKRFIEGSGRWLYDWSAVRS